MDKKYIEGTTESGFEYKIDKRRLDNYELFEKLRELEENPLKAVDVIELMLGDDKDKLRDHLRDEDGFVSMEKMNEEILEIFNSQTDIKKLIFLAWVVNNHENELICDLAETYRIYDYKKLPLTKVAIFLNGLSENSRVMKAISGQKLNYESMLLVSITDKLSMLLWMLSEDGQKNKNRPKLLSETLFESEKENDIKSYSSSEEFEKERAKLLKEVRYGN